MEKMKKAYICSPYRATTDYELDRNIEYAQRLTQKALMDGYAPITPHLYITQCVDDKNPYGRRLGLDAALALLESCDAVYLGLDYGISEGMANEIKKAKRIGIDIVEC